MVKRFVGEECSSCKLKLEYLSSIRELKVGLNPLGYLRFIYLVKEMLGKARES